MRTAPPPAAVRGNQWPSLEVAARSSFVPELPVSVVVTYYEAPEALELTLAALEGQSYPRELFEVVIVDDGSNPPLAAPAGGPPQTRVVHQEDLGFGLARARNTGARAAAHDIIVFLDCDMMPEAGWLAEHARWHHAAGDVLTLGFRSHVDTEGIDPSTVRGRPGSLEELLAGRASQRPEWIEFHMARTSDLTSADDDIFRIVTGGNLGVSRDFFETVGGYDESFTQWGAEDTEFGYRAYTRGGLLVPVREAMCWHQGEGAAPSAAESASLEQQRAKISQLIAHRGFRRSSPGRSFSVPQYVVALRAAVTADLAQLETVEQVLAGSVHDLVVWVEEPDEGSPERSSELEMLRRLFGGDPRVRFGAPGGAPEAHPNASFHVTIPADASVGGDAVKRLRQLLGSAPAAATNPLNPDAGVSIVRAWVLHRAARRGLTLAECETVAPLDPDQTGVSGLWREREQASRPHLTSPTAWAWFFRRIRYRLRHLTSPTAWAWFFRRIRYRLRHLTSPTAWAWFFRRIRLRWRRVWHFTSANVRRSLYVGRSVAREASGVRDLQDARDFGRWAARSVSVIAGKRLDTVRRHSTWLTRLAPTVRLRRRRNAATRLVHKRPASYRLGPAMAASGPVASALFAAAADVEETAGPHTQVIVTDGPHEDQAAPSAATHDKTEHAQGVPTPDPMAHPRDQATPDPAAHAPSQTTRTAATVVLADLEPSASVSAFDPEQFNPSGWSAGHRASHAPLGAARGRALDPNRLKRLRRLHHVTDSADTHRDVLSRAGVLAAAAATGVVVHVTDNDRDLRHHLGEELHSLMAGDRVIDAGDHEREALSIAMRRCALRDHTLRARARQVLAGTSLAAPRLPLVSVLLATRRPRRLAEAIAAVRCQTYPRIELVLATHGDGFDPRTVEKLLSAAGLAAEVVPVPGHAPLGAVLNAAVAASSGALLTKFDDDDFYGPEHLWDLVLAREYSGDCLVGKAAEYVYLETSDRTIARFRNKSERRSSTLAGGALMISRHDLDAVCGWQEIPSGVDRALIGDVTRSGRRVYRTHGMGYMLVRHSEGHTWSARDAYFIKQADEARSGCDLAFAGIT